MTTSYQISDRLHLNKVEVPSTSKTTTVDEPTNTIAVIDCSGSMYDALPRIRDDLKKKLPKLLKEKDTFTLLWFSGKGEYGVILEAEPVATLTDLQRVNQAIDRWLKTVGLTGFKEPLEEVAKVIKRVAAKNTGAFSLFFLSDGCDNQWSRDQVLKAVDAAANAGLAAATFVEYGYYADRPLLTAMAERAGGSLIFSQDFDRYEVVFGDVVQRRMSSKPKVEITLPNADVVGGFAFAMAKGDLLTFAVDGNKVSVPDGTTAVWFLSPNPAGTADKAMEEISKLNKSGAPTNNEALSATYAAASLFSVRMKPEIVKPLLKATGDVRFIEQFNNCFGKQKYSDFMDATKEAVFNAAKLIQKGWDPSKVPADDAFTVLDLLKLLASDKDNRLLLDHEAFKYNKIGRGRLDSAEHFTVDEKDQVLALIPGQTVTWDDAGTFISAVTAASSRAAAQAKFDEIKATKVAALKFVADDAPDGYAVSNLTYNEERPNVSVLVKKTGNVDISGRVPKEHSKLPKTIATFIFRNYAIIKDGLVNVDVLPVKLSDASTAALNKAIKEGKLSKEVIGGGDSIPTGMSAVFLYLGSLPIINAQMVKSVSATALFEKEYALTKARAAQKVYNGVKKEKFPDAKKSEGFSVLYGEDAAAWLKDQGITDYNGFNPKSTVAESKDFYMAKELKVSIKGLSSLPSLKEVREKMTKGKLTASAGLMSPTVKEVDDFLASDVYKKAKKPDDVFAAWLDGQSEEQTKLTRGLIFEMANIKFSVVVGQTWFPEFSSLDEKTLTINTADGKIECTVEPREVQVNI